jgi:uncharacterized membrane protein YqjE
MNSSLSRPPQMPWSDLVSDLFIELSNLMEKEIHLVRTEVKDESRKLLKVALYAMSAGIFCTAFIIMLGLMVVVFLYDAGLPLWGSFATVAVLSLMVTTLLIGCALAEHQIQSAEKWKTKKV